MVKEQAVLVERQYQTMLLVVAVDQVDQVHQQLLAIKQVLVEAMVAVVAVLVAVEVVVDCVMQIAYQ
jgi:hypothetical protein